MGFNQLRWIIAYFLYILFSHWNRLRTTPLHARLSWSGVFPEGENDMIHCCTLSEWSMNLVFLACAVTIAWHCHLQATILKLVNQNAKFSQICHVSLIWCTKNHPEEVLWNLNINYWIWRIITVYWKNVSRSIFSDSVVTFQGSGTWIFGSNAHA